MRVKLVVRNMIATPDIKEMKVAKSMNTSENKEPNKKKRILDFLKNENLVFDHDTGQLIINLNDGGISKITKHIDVVK